MVDTWFKAVRADGNFGKISVGGKIYTAKHIQLVTSSLHKIDDEQLAAEALIIHRPEYADPVPWSPVHTDIDTIIVSVLFKISLTGEHSPLFDAMGFPSGSIALRRQWLDSAKGEGLRGWQDHTLNDLIGPALNGRFYGYHGSLPIPPCFENVHYYVLEQTLPVTALQIQGLAAVLNGETGTPLQLDMTNQRPIQREIGHEALDKLDVEGSATESCSSFDASTRQATSVCWECPSGVRQSPVNIDSTTAVGPVGTPAPGYDLPVVRYHPSIGYSERGAVAQHIRPILGFDFGMLELGGRFYTAEMIQVHAVATHSIDGVRHDGEIHIHHYLYGDWFDSDTVVPGGHDKRRMDAFRGNTHTDENVVGAPSFQVISVIPLQVTTNPAGDFMKSLEAHGEQSGEKPYLSHNDLKDILAGDFFQYRGTLLYPACSDKLTHWILYNKPLKVSWEQLHTEYPTRSGFDTTPNLVKQPDLKVNKNHIPAESLGSGQQCNTYAAHSWNYADAHCWADEYPNCAMSSQSPINIDTTKLVTEAEHLKDNFLNKVKYHPIQHLIVGHTGHSLQVADKMNGISHLGLGYIEVGGHFYFLRQFHIHFPSEHVIDGHQHAAEMHLVHQKQDHWGATGFDNHDILVAAIFFDIGPEESPLLKQLYMPGVEHEAHMNSNWTKQLKEPVDLMRALGPVLQGDYFRYKGSFTTPPCDEVVKWFVFKTSLSISQAQWTSFKGIFPNPANARPVQPLNARTVALNSFEAPGEIKEHVNYEFWLDRDHGRNRDKPTPWVILGAMVGGVLLTLSIMAATFIRSNPLSLRQSAGGLVGAVPEAVGRAASRYRPMDNRA